MKNETFQSITELANFYGAKTLGDLGRSFYDETEFGVSTEFLAECHATEKVLHYEDDAYAVHRLLTGEGALHISAVEAWYEIGFRGGVQARVAV